MFEVRIKVVGGLGEKQGSVDVYHSEHIKKLESALARTVQAQALAVLAKTRALGADAFEFHRLVERRYPAEWRRLKEDWPAAYARTGARVSVQARITNIGNVH